MRRSPFFLAVVNTAAAAVLPRDYSNLPYKKVPCSKPTRPDFPPAPLLSLSALPSPMRGNFIDRSPMDGLTRMNQNHKIKSFRQAVCQSSDVSMRPMLLASDSVATGKPAIRRRTPAENYGDKVQDLSCRWAAKFYGQVTFGPRNYPYPSSRWLARRFRMKKHRIIKRFRFRRYKLAAIANLPFAKMIRVGMLPELKSSKTKKGDTVDASLSQQLVSVAKGAQGPKTSGRRRRPRSKYQV